ncbi:type IV toxin-antitoxin system AbiEi family antitoxin [Catenuloplanes sp. NPDC051500]|uniref:type IV toxin-antitoxin system AbiEi family antitoxin n=1 Tax=Catenuloplanes sp. NPDC051500 TaxID=3363959 RepID=UPI0037991534
MVRHASVPDGLRFLPFRGSRAVARGLITKRQLDSQAWRRLFRDVYVNAESYAADDNRMWCDAAALLLPAGAAIGGESAACLWGAGVPARGAPVTVTVPLPHRLRAQERLVVRHQRLPAGDVTSFGGLPVTSPARTAFDLGRQPDRQKAIMAMAAILHRKLIKKERLAAYADGRAGWPGTVRFAARLDETEPLTESPMETLLRLLITDAGLPRPVAQLDVMSRGGTWLARVDFDYPALRIAIEYEGDHHRDRNTFREDIARKRRLEHGRLACAPLHRRRRAAQTRRDRPRDRHRPQTAPHRASLRVDDPAGRSGAAVRAPGGGAVEGRATAVWTDGDIAAARGRRYVERL